MTKKNEAPRRLLDRVYAILGDDSDKRRMRVGDVVDGLRSGSLAVLRVDRLEQLLDKYDQLEASLVDEKTNTGKKVEQALFDLRESEANYD